MSTEIESRQEYNEYLMECHMEGVVKPRSYHEWLNRGMVLLPHELKRLKGDQSGDKSVRVNKAALARVIFDEEQSSGQINRKRIIERFVIEAGLTQAGANTYYCNHMNRIRQEQANG